ncbi:hypothetical protein ACO0QE_004135 [Hanseniaspora vineae]
MNSTDSENNTNINVARKPQMIISHKRNNSANTNRPGEQQQNNDANLNQTSEEANKRKLDRQRLKEYYARLKEQNGQLSSNGAVPRVSVDNSEQSSNDTASTDQTHTDKKTQQHEESSIIQHGRHFNDLLHDYNTLKVQEVDGLKDIKTNIYDNYYDLVKINNLLQENKQKTAGSVDKLNALISDLKRENSNTVI